VTADTDDDEPNLEIDMRNEKDEEEEVESPMGLFENCTTPPNLFQNIAPSHPNQEHSSLKYSLPTVPMPKEALAIPPPQAPIDEFIDLATLAEVSLAYGNAQSQVQFYQKVTHKPYTLYFFSTVQIIPLKLVFQRKSFLGYEKLLIVW